MTGRKVLRFRWCDQWSTSDFSELLPEINKATSIIVLWFSFVAWNQVFLCKLFEPRSQEDRPVCQNLWTFLKRRNSVQRPKKSTRRCATLLCHRRLGFCHFGRPSAPRGEELSKVWNGQRSVNSYYYSHTFRTYPKHAVCFIKGSEITLTNPQISFHESLSLIYSSWSLPRDGSILPGPDFFQVVSTKFVTIHLYPFVSTKFTAIFRWRYQPQTLPTLPRTRRLNLFLIRDLQYALIVKWSVFHETTCLWLNMNLLTSRVNSTS